MQVLVQVDRRRHATCPKTRGQATPIAKIQHHILNADFSKVVEITSDRLGKDHAYKLDSSKLRTELNWQDKITFSDGVMKTFNWINENQRYFKISDLSYQIGGQS